MGVRYWLLGCLAATALIACGSNSGSGGDDDGSSGGTVDAGAGGGTTGDAPFGGGCGTGSPQCSNCVDDDADGKVDGFDAECTGPLDNDESSFATGIPGDNIDAVMQDCFFDGNSGAGNDGCNIHVCCLLGAPDQQSCPIGANKYNITECPPPLGNTPLPQKCIDVCGKLAPPGCDCFGCCTICDGAGMCRDVDINPAVSPNCDQTNVNDPGPDGMIDTNDDPCRKCIQNTDCGSPECGGATCVLCPGQDPSTLPSSCGGMSTCPDGYMACAADGTCPEGTYCSNGCCIGTLF